MRHHPGASLFTPPSTAHGKVRISLGIRLRWMCSGEVFRQTNTRGPGPERQARAAQVGRRRAGCPGVMG